MSMHLNLGNLLLIRVYNGDETGVYTSVQSPYIHWHTQRGVWGVQTPPPRNYSEVLTKPSRIPSSVENRS
jgi:hypothetical protein